MADIKVLKVNAEGLYQEHDEANDSLKVKELKIGDQVLDETKLADLIEGGDASTQHHHDSLYFRESEHVATSAGAGDAGKPIVLDAGGKIDESLLPTIVTDHGDLTGLGDDDHTQYTRADGTRAFTGDQSMGGNKLTNLANPSVGSDAVNLQTMQAYLEGLKPKEAVRVLVAEGDDLATGLRNGDIVDGVELAVGDRILLIAQLNPAENGIYVVQNSAPPVRATDFDSLTPIDEINGAYVPVSEGNVNAGKFFVKVGQTNTLGTDAINFVFFNSVATLSGGDGITITGTDIEVDLASNSGLKFISGELAVEPADFAGEGLVDDGADNLALDWSTSFNDAKAIKASDLSSQDAGKGASIIGIEDAGDRFISTNLEGAINEIADSLEEMEIPVQRYVYVDKNGDDTTGTGTELKPFLTIQGAQTALLARTPAPSLSTPYVIKVGVGVYDLPNSYVPAPYIYVLGSGIFGGTDYTTIRRRNLADTDYAPIAIEIGNTDASKLFSFENLTIAGGLTWTRLNNENGVATSLSVLNLRRVTMRSVGASSSALTVVGSAPNRDSINISDDCGMGAVNISGAQLFVTTGSSIGALTVTEGTNTGTQTFIEGPYKTICTVQHAYVSGGSSFTGNVRLFSIASRWDGAFTADKVSGPTLQNLLFDAVSYPKVSFAALTLNNGASLVRMSYAEALLVQATTPADWNVNPTQVNGALDELASRLKIAEVKIEDEAGHVKYTAGASGITKGDLVYLSSANTVEKYTNLSNNDEVLGIALETVASGATVQVSALDEILEGVLTGAVVNSRYYWDGSALSTSMSTASGANVWLVGVAVSATDLAVKVRHVRKNA